MRAEAWALLTAICWGTGSLLEKKGVKLGGLAPVMGTTIRTTFSLMLLLAVSSQYWGQVRTAGLKSILLIAVGGGVLAGGAGIICLYTGLKSGDLSTVLTVAFCGAPVVGAILGYLFLDERLTALQLLGIAMCVGGAALVTFYRQH